MQIEIGNVKVTTSSRVKPFLFLSLVNIISTHSLIFIPSWVCSVYWNLCKLGILNIHPLCGWNCWKKKRSLLLALVEFYKKNAQVIPYKSVLWRWWWQKNVENRAIKVQLYYWALSHYKFFNKSDILSREFSILFSFNLILYEMVLTHEACTVSVDFKQFFIFMMLATVVIHHNVDHCPKSVVAHLLYTIFSRELGMVHNDRLRLAIVCKKKSLSRR